MRLDGSEAAGWLKVTLYGEGLAALPNVETFVEDGRVACYFDERFSFTEESWGSEGTTVRFTAAGALTLVPGVRTHMIILR